MATKSLPITKQVEIINKKEFAKVVLNKNIKVFVMHVTFLSFNKIMIIIYLTKKAQIALLLTKEVKILAKYLDFFNVFSKKKALVLLEITKLN